MTKSQSQESRAPYAAPRLVEHGSIQELTLSSPNKRRVEKHPLDLKAGSKIRPRPR